MSSKYSSFGEFTSAIPVCVQWGEGNRCCKYSEIDLRIAKAFLDAGASTDFLDLAQLPDRPRNCTCRKIGKKEEIET